MTRQLLVAGNSKVGRSVFCFNLPWVETCPGATAQCKRSCYARHFARYGHQQKYAENWEFAKAPSFVSDMVAEIRARDVKIVRIHVSGDFFSTGYVRKWIKIVRALPRTIFYSYTRSFHVRRQLNALNDLRRLPNIQLWWSTDRDAPDAPEGRIAYMSVNDEDLPPEHADMVFRVRRNTVRRTLGGCKVCPKESGDPPKGLTCGKCRECFKQVITS